MITNLKDKDVKVSVKSWFGSDLNLIKEHTQLIQEEIESAEEDDEDDEMVGATEHSDGEVDPIGATEHADVEDQEEGGDATPMMDATDADRDKQTPDADAEMTGATEDSHPEQSADNPDAKAEAQ